MAASGDEDRGVHIRVDEPAWSPTSVLGSMLTARHEYDTFTALDSWGYWSIARDNHGLHDNEVVRDERIVKQARRWSGSPVRPPAHGNYVPGDVAGLRLAAITHDLVERAKQRIARIESGENLSVANMEARAIGLDGCVRHWIYSAASYFLPTATIVALANTSLSDDDLDELRLPHQAVAIYFGGDLDIPFELIEADTSRAQLQRRIADTYDPASGRVDADNMPATITHHVDRRIARNQQVALCGVILHADDHGRLDDTVLWLTACPDDPVPNRDVIYGSLNRALLRYVALNLAAVVAWGQWTNPQLDTPLGSPTDPNFRTTIRASKFRKQEPAGGALGVHVLDVKRTTAPPNRPTTSTHASPVEHPRRPHWNRYRVGPRDDWHYERRHIGFTIVNAGHTDDRIIVRRLPPPPPR
jgi:hypothetical protein